MSSYRQHFSAILQQLPENLKQINLKFGWRDKERIG
jgi:hypothetical protein